MNVRHIHAWCLGRPELGFREAERHRVSIENQTQILQKSNKYLLAREPFLQSLILNSESGSHTQPR